MYAVMEPRRLFVSVDPPGVAVAHLGAVVDGLEVARENRPGHSTRLSDRDQWHLTLAFLGEVPAARLDSASRAIESAVAAFTSARIQAPGDDGGAEGVSGDGSGEDPDSGSGGDDLGSGGEGLSRDGGAAPIWVRFAGAGTFGRGRSTILWAGVDGDLAGLHRLAQAVRRELRRTRLPHDRKPFRPHLTLSKPGTRASPEQVAADLLTLAEYRGPQWHVDAVHLVASDTVMTPTGPRSRYTRLASVALP
ncbi:MAG TPA: 2'-5' RNA ligase family protein [Micromonosporaceae bacterium]